MVNVKVSVPPSSTEASEMEMLTSGNLAVVNSRYALGPSW